MLRIEAKLQLGKAMLISRVGQGQSYVKSCEAACNFPVSIDLPGFVTHVKLT